MREVRHEEKDDIDSSAIVLLLAVITTIIVISVNRGKIKVFTDTNYPGFYKQKDNNIVFRLKDKNNYDVPWQIEEESGIVEVSAKGKKPERRYHFLLHLRLRESPILSYISPGNCLASTLILCLWRYRLTLPRTNREWLLTCLGFLPLQIMAAA